MSQFEITLDDIDRYRSLDNLLLETQNTTFSAQEIRETIETEIISQATYFSTCQYYIHEYTGIWGEVGPFASRLSFLRIILGMSEHETIYPQHDIDFETKKTELYNQYQLSQFSIDDLKSQINDYTFISAGLKFQLQDSEKINTLFRFINSTLCLQSGDYGDERELILGRGTNSQFDEYTVIDLSIEVMRTPNIVTSLAAAIGHNQIFIRRESLNGIFQLKWHSFLEYPYPYQNQPEFIAAHQLKKLTCTGYAINDLVSLNNAKPLFLDDMRENVLFHELGHAVIQHRLLPKRVATFSEASKSIPHPLIHSLLELLAEIAPYNGNIRGPLQNITDVSQNDHKRAERMFWMYMSDTWFFDTSDDYMFFYSDLVALTFSPAIQPNFNLDFKILANHLWSNSGILMFILSTVTTLCETVIKKLEPLRYEVNDTIYSYTDAIIHITNKIHEETIEKSSDYLLQTAVWHELIKQALKNETFTTECVLYLDSESKQILTELAKKVGIPDSPPRQGVIKKLILY